MIIYIFIDLLGWCEQSAAFAQFVKSVIKNMLKSLLTYLLYMYTIPFGVNAAVIEAGQVDPTLQEP